MRVTEKFPGCEFAQLVIYTGKSLPTDHNRFVQQFHGATITYDFDAYLVRDQKRAVLEADRNPFALAVLACLTLIEKERHFKDDFEWLLRQKIALARLCFQKGFSKYEIENLLIFVSFIISLPEDKTMKYEEEVAEYLLQEEPSLAEQYPQAFEMFVNLGLKLNGPLVREHDSRIKAEAKEEGKEETSRQHVLRMHKKGFSNDTIADVLELEMDFVEKAIREATDPKTAKPAQKRLKKAQSEPKSTKKKKK